MSYYNALSVQNQLYELIFWTTAISSDQIYLLIRTILLIEKFFFLRVHVLFCRETDPLWSAWVCPVRIWAATLAFGLPTQNCGSLKWMCSFVLSFVLWAFDCHTFPTVHYWGEGPHSKASCNKPLWQVKGRASQAHYCLRLQLLLNAEELGNRTLSAPEIYYIARNFQGQ